MFLCLDFAKFFAATFSVDGFSIQAFPETSSTEIFNNEFYFKCEEASVLDLIGELLFQFKVLGLKPRCKK